MGTKESHEGGHLTIMEAIDALSSIAETEVSRDITLLNEEIEALASAEERARQYSVDWLHQDLNITIEMMRDVFRCVLGYLRTYYKKEYRYMPNQQTTEGIKGIMVLVGEAAKKLDKYASLVHHTKENCITQLKEYKRLQDFYLSRIARRIDEGVLSKWILALSQRIMSQQPEVTKPSPVQLIQAKHVFVDLESVKKDNAYELFFIRKEGGARFFSPRLIRNIKLVCDFGDSLSEVKRDDPLESIQVWRDKWLQMAAENILHTVAPFVDRFYHEAAKVRDEELPMDLSKALIGLMLGSNVHNLFHDPTVKNCSDYFADFQFFLREALHSREYQKLVAYPPKKTNTVAHCLLDLTNALCRACFIQLRGHEELLPHVKHLIQEAHEELSAENADAWADGKQLWTHLNNEYAAMAKLLKRHPNGPLTKVLDSLENGDYQAFDPWHQFNIPQQLFSLEVSGRHMAVVHMPAPVRQEFINKAAVSEEFKGFLRSQVRGHAVNKHLMFNLQDRTSWREHARCVVLEELQKHSDFAQQLTVVTLPKDTEFYHQETPYHQENHTKIFLELFKEQLEDENCGFHFPEQLKEQLFPEFADGVLHAIHAVFFGNKNVLSLEHRKNFIEIFYLFMQLKIVEIVEPSSLSMTCKDGVDTGSAAIGQLYAFLKLLHQPHMSKGDLDQLNLILFGPALMVRERVMLSDRFHRMLSMIKEMEQVKSEHGAATFSQEVMKAFSPFFKSDILKTFLPEPLQEETK